MTSDTTSPPPKKLPDLERKESFGQKVTVRDFSGGRLLPKGLPTVALAWELRGRPVLYVWRAGTSIRCRAGAEVTAADGTVWTVAATEAGRIWVLCYVERKAP
jgi:hypothetical protein